MILSNNDFLTENKNCYFFECSAKRNINVHDMFEDSFRYYKKLLRYYTTTSLSSPLAVSPGLTSTIDPISGSSTNEALPEPEVVKPFYPKKKNICLIL